MLCLLIEYMMMMMMIDWVVDGWMDGINKNNQCSYLITITSQNQNGYPIDGEQDSVGTRKPPRRKRGQRERNPGRPSLVIPNTADASWTPSESWRLCRCQICHPPPQALGVRSGVIRFIRQFCPNPTNIRPWRHWYQQFHPKLDSFNSSSHSGFATNDILWHWSTTRGSLVLPSDVVLTYGCCHGCKACDDGVCVWLSLWLLIQGNRV